MKQRLGFLDSLRGFAALYVLVFHLALVPSFKPEIPAWAIQLVMFGGSGVTLFFVLSAFSLCLTMPGHLATENPLRSYYLSRFFRIAPLFYALIILTYIRDATVFGVWRTPTDVALAASMTFNLVPGYQQGFVWASWTIGVEVMFYLAFPFLYTLLFSTWSRLVAFVLACVAAELIKTLVSPDYFTWSIVRHLPVFFAGMLAFSIYEWLAARRRTGVVGALLFAIGIVGLVALVASGRTTILLLHVYYWQAIFFVCIVLGLALWPWRLVVNSLTTTAGSWSYSSYLLHAPTIYFLSPAYERIYALPMTVTLKFATCLLLTLAIVTPLAALSYRLIERPGEVFGRGLRSTRNAVLAPKTPI